MKSITTKSSTKTGFWDHLWNVYLWGAIKRNLGLFEKETKVLLNDKGAMLITVLIPLIIVILLATIGNTASAGADPSSTKLFSEMTKVETPKIGIIDYDTSEGFPGRDISSEFVAIFEREHELKNCILYKTSNQSELELMLGLGKLNAFLIVPELFEFNLSIHLPVIVPFVLDSVNVFNLQSAQGFIENIIFEFKQTNDFTGVFKVEKIKVNAPQRNQIFFAAAPFILPAAIFGIACLTACQSIVSDIPKDRMVLTPTNKLEMLNAKITANILIQLIVAGIFLFVSAIIRLEIRSSYLIYFLVFLIMIINSTVIGMCISAIAKTALSALQFFIFTFIFQLVAVFFIESPLILNFLPVYNGYYLILQMVFRGQHLWGMRYTFFYMIFETVILYLISYLFFKRQKTML